MLDHKIFQRAQRLLKFKPGVDLFAADFHYQLPRYYAMEDDPEATGKYAFKADCLLEYYPHINPPWLLVPKCLEKVIADQAVVMFVVNKWEDAKFTSQKPYT